MAHYYAPGMRVVIRDAEWVIRRVDHASDGGWQLSCNGISELVREREALFLTKLEDEKNIQILDPAKTELVADSSPAFQQSLLYIESLLRRRSVNDDNIHIAHKGAMDVVAYQLDPALQALRQPRQRILIADAVGLGKTLEAGILVSELMHRGRGKRILVLTQKSMLTQFQKEFWSRFSIPLTRLDSVGLQRVRNRIPTNHNPFYYYDKSIISTDTLKQDSEYRVYLEQAYWDIIIIDECHNVADRGSGSQRTRLARLLASRSDTLIMLSATPHDGRAKSFASLMNMLDPTAISDDENYVKEDFSSKGLVIRRFKKDIQQQVKGSFKERKVFKKQQAASWQEENAYDALLDVAFTRGGEVSNHRQTALLRVTLQKALFSSPQACRKSVEERINRLQRDYPGKPAVQAEIAGLQDLQAALASVTPLADSKYQALRTLLTSDSFAWSVKISNDRLVIFSERIETLHYLLTHLQADFKLKTEQVRIMHGGMPDIEQQEIVEQFGKPDSPLRVLLCSDVASEGINLHYQAHRLIHYDMPWSLMVFQQRNGRVDRYGQEQEPQIYYLLTTTQNPTIQGDLRILEVLQEKDDQAYQNIGDPSVFMNVYDVAEEERLTSEAMAAGQTASAFDAQYQPAGNNAGDDLLAMFMDVLTAPAPAQPQATAQDNIQEPLSLFADEYRWSKTALQCLLEQNPQWQINFEDAARSITLKAPDDLVHRLRQLPDEARPEHDHFVLTDQIEQITAEIARSREDENAWPKRHYLWQQHPVSQWLNDRMLALFGRHTAPVLVLPQGLEVDETCFVLSGLIPNRKSHPLIHEWIGVRWRAGQCVAVEDFSVTLERTQLGKSVIPNRKQAVDLAALQASLPQVIEQARSHLKQVHQRFVADLKPRLDQQLAELEKLRGKQMQQLELRFTESVQAVRKEQQARDIEQVFTDYQEWVRDTLTTEDQPYLQVIAVLIKG